MRRFQGLDGDVQKAAGAFRGSNSIDETLTAVASQKSSRQKIGKVGGEDVDGNVG